ncbi:MAG: AlpA family phage regulatory protein [Thiolinea sp.]
MVNNSNLVPTAPDRAIRMPEVIQLTGMSRTSIYEAIKSGTFPKGFLIGKRARGWMLSTVMNWLQEKAEAHYE